MDERYTIQKLLVLRKVTRAVADELRGQLKGHLTTLAPLFRPRNILGEQVRGGVKESAKGSEKVFQDLLALYSPIAATKLYDLPKALTPPLELPGSALEISPVEQSYTAKTDKETKTITITSPLKWILSYSGYGPKQLRDLLATRASRTGDELGQTVLHFCALHLMLNVVKQTGLAELLGGLRFSVASSRVPEFGDLPVTVLTAAIPTLRPPDEVIIESTEISGAPVFEEVVDIDGIINLRDPLRARAIELVNATDASLLPK
jgi:hypothetical protein